MKRYSSIEEMVRQAQVNEEKEILENILVKNKQKMRRSGKEHEGLNKNRERGPEKQNGKMEIGKDGMDGWKDGITSKS
jgi:hypothetical protein